MEVLRRSWELFFSLPWLGDTADYLHSLPMHPVFTTVHFILTALVLRKEPGSVQFAVQYPVASCMMTHIVACSGGILANLMTGAPPLECVTNEWSVMASVISWYLVFFSPLDVCVYLCSTTPVQLALHTVEEVGRAKKILSGVTMASTLYPHSILAMAIVGMLKGSGKMWGITWYRLVYQPHSALPTSELKGVSFITKMSLFLALLFSANVQSQSCDQHQLLMMVAICLVVVRYRSLLVAETDFFDPVFKTIWELATVLSIGPPPHDDTIHTTSNNVQKHRGNGEACTEQNKKSHED